MQESSQPKVGFEPIAATGNGYATGIGANSVVGRWNAPTEVVHLLGYDCPVFRRTKRWLESERSPRISC